MDGCSCSSWTSRRCAGLARRNETARAALGGSLPSAPVWRGGVALPLLQPGRNVVTVPPGESQPASDLGPSVLSRPPFCMHPSRRLVSHNPPFPSRAADLLRDGAGAAGRDRGERRAGGWRTVSAAPEARHPGPAGRRDCPSALSRACRGLRRWTTPSALFCPGCRPAPSAHEPSCAQVGPWRGACDLPPAPPPPAVGSRAQGVHAVSLCESPST